MLLETFPLQHMTAFIQEFLRMYQQGVRIGRYANTDTILLPNGKKIRMQKKSKIRLPIYQLHHDPAIFPDPEAFDPDRF